MADGDPSPDRLLEQEYAYAREATLQAHRERSTAVSLYLGLALGVVALALATLQTTISRGPDAAGGILVLLFSFLALAGVVTIVRLVRLEQAWHESVLVMDKIKEHYAVRFPGLRDVLLWRTDNIPAPGRFFSTTFVLSLLVMIMDSAAAGAAVHATGFRIALGDYAVDAFVIVIFAAWQTFYYFYQL
jgi:hypothetical protein